MQRTILVGGCDPRPLGVIERTEVLMTEVTYVTTVEAIPPPFICSTRLEQVSGTLEWTVATFKVLANRAFGTYVISRPFKVGDATFTLHLHPAGAGETSRINTNRQFAAWYLCNESKHEVNAVAELVVLGAAKAPVAESVCSESVYAKKDDAKATWGRVNDLKREVLLAAAEANNDQLTMVATVTINNVRHSGEDTDELAHARATEHTLSLVDDMCSLFHSCAHSDVKLTAAGGGSRSTFAGHKAVLAARSPVFAAMFSHGMKESKSNTVELPDMEPLVLNEFLHFLYTGRLTAAYQPSACAGTSTSTRADARTAGAGAGPAIKATKASQASRTTAAAAATGTAIEVKSCSTPGPAKKSASSVLSWFQSRSGSMDSKRTSQPAIAAAAAAALSPEIMVAHLLVAANKYQVPSLARLCADAMKHHMSTDNVIEMINVADRHHNAPLKAHCLKFLVEDKTRFAAVKQTEAFKTLDKRLLVDLLDALTH